MTSADGTVTYTYDALGQLLAADYSNESLADESYSYDANGNRITANGSPYTTGADNQLLSDGTYTYAYDNEGNRVLRYIDADQDGEFDAGDTDATVYEWDVRNRLVEVSDYATYTTFTAETPSQVVHYFYDVENRLIAEQLDTDGDGEIDKTLGYAYDGDQITLQFESSGSGPLNSSHLSHRYLWQANAIDQIMADEQVTTPSSPGSVVWPLTDHLGTVRDLAAYDDATGITSIANHRVYDSYGNLTSKTNAAVDCLFGFTGRAYDALTGLQDNWHRKYDPAIGRWTSEDPIRFTAGQSNLNAYCGNSPTNGIDPCGMKSVKFMFRSNIYMKKFYTIDGRERELGPGDLYIVYDDDSIEIIYNRILNPGASVGARPDPPKRGTKEWANAVLNEWRYSKLSNQPDLCPDEADVRIAYHIFNDMGIISTIIDTTFNPAWEECGAMKVLDMMEHAPKRETLPRPVDHPHSR